ncbi:MAG TPA: hypothetical protein VLG41_19700 [Hydrogenophaga sp.]|uniref:hypothetical protein n=1 Tax=Hydrogenophaga sp. TaxID=1904254 RepID=UPI002B9D310F|nr:hypothetical protein [Hydrogenophaga sp.]HSX95158.1 hypothetical protein [Hydrogenophaga sp.]
MPELQTDSSNLRYERDEDEGGQDSGSLTPPLHLELSSMESLEVVTFSGEDSSSQGQPIPSLARWANSGEEELGVEEFLAELGRGSAAHATLRSAVDDPHKQHRPTRHSKVRQELAAKITQASHKLGLDLKRLLPQTEVTPATPTSLSPTFMRGSPRSVPSTRRSARESDQERKRPVSPVVHTGHVRGGSYIDQSPTQLWAVSPSKTCATKGHETVADKEPLPTPRPSKQTRRGLTKREPTSFVSVRRKRGPAASKQAGEVARHANELNLRMLQTDLEELDHVYDDLRATYPYEETPAKQPQEKSENS